MVAFKRRSDEKRGIGVARKEEDVTQLIGETPVMRLNKMGGDNDATLWGA